MTTTVGDDLPVPSRAGDAPMPPDDTDLEPDEGRHHRQLPRATSQRMWLLGYGAVVGVALARVPRLYADLQDRVPQEMLDRLEDPAMVTLALRVGTFLGVVAYPVVVAVMFAVFASIERRVFPVAVLVARRVQVGIFFAAAVLLTLPVQLVGLVAGIPGPVRGPGLYVFAVAVLAVLWWRWRAGWQMLSTPRRVLVPALTVAVAALLTVG